MTPDLAGWIRFFMLGIGAATLLSCVVALRHTWEHQQSEEELRAGEERFRATFEQAGVGMYYADREGRFLRINPRFCAITGYSAAELLELSVGELSHPDDRAADEERRRQLLAGGQPAYSGEQRYLHKDGTTIWVNLSVSSLRTPSGSVDELLGVAEEITDRKVAEWALRQLNATLEERICERTTALSRANEQLKSEIAVRRQVEVALHESEQQYRTLLECMDQGVIVFQNDRVVFCNRAFAELIGHSIEYLCTASLEELLRIVHRVDRQWMEERVTAQFERGLVADEQPFRFYRAYDDTVRWLYSSSQIISYQGQPAMLSVFTDITELKEVEERLRQSHDELRAANLELARAARLKDEFLANISHELRTPLNAILGRAEILTEGLQGLLNERQLRSVTSIEESGRHLLELINDILDLSKLEASKLDLQPEPVSVTDLCEASVRLVHEAAGKKRINLSSDLDPQVTMVKGDPRRLKQILVNLLTNAVKFTAAEGKVGLTVRGDPAACLATFTIWDTGIGIAEGDLPRLFRPFEQLDSSLSRQYEGTGLGLSLVARLIRLHGGYVAVESTLGEGSRFTVTLPWHPGEFQDSRR